MKGSFPAASAACEWAADAAGRSASSRGSFPEASSAGWLLSHTTPTQLSHTGKKEPLPKGKIAAHSSLPLQPQMQGGRLENLPLFSMMGLNGGGGAAPSQKLSPTMEDFLAIALLSLLLVSSPPSYAYWLGRLGNPNCITMPILHV